MVYIVLSSDLDGDVYIEGVFADEDAAEQFMNDKNDEDDMAVDYWMEAHTVK